MRRNMKKMDDPASGNATAGISRSRFAVFIPLSLIFLSAAFITRLVLLVKSLHMIQPSAGLLLKIFGTGLFYDCVTLSYAAGMAALLLIALPGKIYQRVRFYYVFITLLFSAVVVIVFSCFAEYLFFDEYGTRFNFIAVDYLIYTT